MNTKKKKSIFFFFSTEKLFIIYLFAWILIELIRNSLKDPLGISFSIFGISETICNSNLVFVLWFFEYFPVSFIGFLSHFSTNVFLELSLNWRRIISNLYSLPEHCVHYYFAFTLRSLLLF